MQSKIIYLLGVNSPLYAYGISSPNSMMTFLQDDDFRHQYERNVDFTHETISKVVINLI